MNEDEIRERWYEFSNRAFVEWRGATRKTLTDFAGYLGLSQSLVSQELKKNGKIPRDVKTITAWVDKYGDQVYDVLGMPKPDTSEAFSSLPESIKSAVIEIRDTLGKHNLSPDSLEAKPLIDEIMKKHGYTSISITSEHER